MSTGDLSHRKNIVPIVKPPSSLGILRRAGMGGNVASQQARRSCRDLTVCTKPKASRCVRSSSSSHHHHNHHEVDQHRRPQPHGSGCCCCHFYPGDPHSSSELGLWNLSIPHGDHCGIQRTGRRLQRNRMGRTHSGVLRGLLGLYFSHRIPRYDVQYILVPGPSEGMELTIASRNEQWKHRWAVLVWICLPRGSHERVVLCTG